MATRSKKVAAVLCVCLAAGSGLADPAVANVLKPETAAAFEQYVHRREAQMEESFRSGNFLYSDTLPEASRKALEADLRQGKVFILEVTSIAPSQPVRIPNGLIHDWLGMAFIPGATVAKVNAILRDADRQQVIYKPNILRSKLLESNGNQYKIFLQFHTKAIITVILNGTFSVAYYPMSETRMESRSYSTRFAEVADAGKPTEHELTDGKEHGYMWRMNSYWKVEQRDGGVYIQAESIGLTRGVPFLYAWLVDPFLKSLPKQYLTDLLVLTRKAVLADRGAAAGNGYPQ
jgi:hypothetical protein